MTGNAAEKKGGVSLLWVTAKIIIAGLMVLSGVNHFSSTVVNSAGDDGSVEVSHRRLAEASSFPYMQSFMDDLAARKKLFEESEVMKYWFEYTGELQVSFNAFDPWKNHIHYCWVMIICVARGYFCCMH